VTEQELDEFRRYLIGQSTEVLTMDEYAKLRETGGFDDIRSMAGQNSADEERDPREVENEPRGHRPQGGR
jgi:hypothetical protein